MKKLLVILPFLAIVVFLASYFVYKSGKGEISITSPLPGFLSRIMNTQASTLNLWLPQVDESKITGPDITAHSALVYDLTSNQTLFAKNAKEKVPMASLTKIMTAIIALENKMDDDKYLVKKIDLVGEDSMGLSENEVLNLNELLYGLILHSGNDAAETIASNYPKGGREGFIKAMNDKAYSLGLNDTAFTDPSGLGDSGLQYSTPYDLLVMTNYAMSFPLFAQIAQTASYTIAKTTTHEEYILESETNLLTTYPGVKGVKTGYTDEAGLCLITYLDYDGKQIIAIILNSTDRRGDMRSLLDFALIELGINPPPHPQV